MRSIADRDIELFGRRIARHIRRFRRAAKATGARHRGRK
jgi:hypothetical protein